MSVAAMLAPRVVALRTPATLQTKQALRGTCWGPSKRLTKVQGPLKTLHPHTKCNAAPPVQPDGSMDTDTDSLPRYEVFEDEVVVHIDDKECRVFSAVDAVDRIGTVIFLSGFAQTPEAYKIMLERCASAGIVVLAPLTSTLGTSRNKLQNDLVDEAAFWMDLALDGSNKELGAYLPHRGAPVGILGHSVGGGLTYALAARFPQAKAIASLSPTPDLVEEFEPEQIIASEDFLTPRRRALVLAGGLDPYSKESNIRSDIITPLVAALGEGAVNFELHKFGLHTMYQDFIDFPLEDIVAGIWKAEESQEAFLTALEQFPGLLANKLFISGLRFELGLAAVVYAYGALSDTEWVKWVAGGAVITALVIAATVELIKNATGQPENVSERVATFFHDEF